MKLSLAFVALAGAVAPPRIELNLEGMTSAYKLENSIVREHDQGLVQNTGDKVMSRQDWTEKCAAQRKCTAGQNCAQDGVWITTTSANCPFPVAKGFDHQDRNVDVTTRIFLVDSDGSASNSASFSNDQDVQFGERATYLFKYDASDAAGNHAEQVVFALILDDTEAPFFNENCEAGNKFEPAITVEAVSDWSLCQLETVDNVDASTAASTYKIAYLGRDHQEFDTVKANYFNAAATHADLAALSSFAQARAFFTPKPDFGPMHVGKFLVTISTVDTAGVYGHNAADNTRSIQQAILVRDTVVPTIYLQGSDPTFVECRKTVANNGRATGTATSAWDFEAYSGSESDCRDQLDTVALKRYLPVTTTIRASGTHNIVGTPSTTGIFPQGLETRVTSFGDELKVLGTHNLDYTCFDYADNTAATVSRVISTVDTHQPTLHLKHAGVVQDSDTHKVVYELTSDDASLDVTVIHATKADQVYCEDSCDATINTNSVSMSWGPRAFNAKILGDYVRTYTCSDAENNVATKTRTYTVVDNDVPEITMIPSEGNMGTFEASRDVEYTDTGATCHDFVDGELSHAVEVSGEVVNMRIPGTYEINYDCQDLSGNSAIQQTRNIVITDSTQPVLSLLGASINYVEAGFPYVDAGATATDSLDGDITQYIWTDGNTVTTKNAFYAQKSCTGIFSETNAANNGEYYITVERPNGAFQRELVHCFKKGGKSYTYYLHSAGQPVDCASRGLIGTKNGVISKYIKQIGTKNFNGGNMDAYVCTVADENDTKTRNFATHSWANKITNAEQGKYVINFNVEDKFGNSADNVIRTVVVKDTLPPVITLHLNNKLVHTGAHQQMGIPAVVANGSPVHAGSMVNPAGYAVGAATGTPLPAAMSGFGNPNFMAESTSTNGWLIGAAASAVAGVALLGFSARKSTVTSVPV